MEENKNYTEPEKIEQTKSVESLKEKKSLGKKQWIIIGAAVLALAVVIVVAIWLIGGNNPPVETDPVETTIAGKWYPAESVEDLPSDVDPKQEDVFYD